MRSVGTEYLNRVNGDRLDLDTVGFDDRELMAVDAVIIAK
jgi:hypothetical protein